MLVVPILSRRDRRTVCAHAALRALACAMALSSACAPEADASAEPLTAIVAAQEIPAEEPAAPVPSEPPAGASFGAVTLHGSGCSDRDATALIREDRKTATVYFEQFESVLFDDEVSTETDCLIEFDVQAPAGYTYTVTQLYYNVLGEVPDGVEATLKAGYGFDGEGPLTETLATLPSNRPDEPIRPHAVKHVITGSAWAPCAGARKLQAHVSISLRNSEPKTFAKLTLIQVDGRNEREGEGAIELGLSWARCPDVAAAVP